ncbi:hypothetical protein AB4251_23010, partial [Vibrio lentus]
MRVNEIRDAKSLKSRYKELDEGNGMRDTKGKNKRRRFFSFSALSSSLLVTRYSLLVTRYSLLVTRYSFTRISHLLLSLSSSHL